MAKIGGLIFAIGEWEYYDAENSDTDIQFVPTLKIGPKYHNNAFYSLARDGCLGELKFVEGEISWKVYKHPFDEETSSLNSSYLVEVDGELVSVFIGGHGSWVKVFKFNISDKCWIKLDTLGEHTLFVSPASSFSIKTDKSEMRNRIYLPRRKENKIVFYSLDTGKYHTSTSANSLDDFYGTKAQSFCCWVNISL
ncbi:F-box/kelch-repeat protein At1g57790-like [Silene latifolia]|uniref:F-box/kelch-repeat protein At1g57790-like n=1 Tax=Silene latifolia TaxID=37657 RepID=UPI003D76CAB9